jgi:hypothetical protein
MLPMSSLISPPEQAPYESFSHSPQSMSMASSIKQDFPKTLSHFPSPPVSPETKSRPEDRSEPTVNDPILYPHQDLTRATSSQPPLFVDVDEELADRVVDEHIRSLEEHQLLASPPPRHDYLLVIEVKSQMLKQYNANPQRWLKRERQYLLDDQKSRKKSQFAKIAPAPPKSRPLKVNGDGVAKSLSRPRGPRVAGSKPSTPIIKKRYSSPNPFATPKPTSREDKNFNDFPDYCPPFSTLPNRPNSMKVDWKGAPIDLHDDQYRHLLHPDELILAANLRLDCATYLTSKRRIFIARVECLRIGKEFRKTDSQQACKIDVNKASKLWQAFEKVGWLRAEHFRKYV